MPLCSECRSEAEVVHSGPTTPGWVRWLGRLFGLESNTDNADQCDECSRCGRSEA